MDEKNKLENLKNEIEELEKKIEIKRKIEELERKKNQLEKELIDEDKNVEIIDEILENENKNEENILNENIEEDFYSVKEYEWIMLKRKIIVGVIIFTLFSMFLFYFFNFLNSRAENEAEFRKKIEKIQKEAMEKATKEAEAKAKIEMDRRLEEEIEKIIIEDMRNRVDNKSLNKTLEEFPTGKKLEELVEKSKKTDKSIDELIQEEINSKDIIENIGNKINDFIGFIFDFFQKNTNNEN